jgi:heme exporter protein C
MRKSWWKILCVILLAYTIVAGLLLPVPKLPLVHESIRNLYFHVPMWFCMTVLFVISVVYSIKYLSSNNLKDDLYAASFAKVGVVFSVLGMITGMEWAYFTWPTNVKDANFFWTGDPKQLCAAICMLIYMAYLVLRGSIADFDQRAKISAVYNVFACALMFPLIFVIPRMVESLHPGSGGNNPADPKNLDALMRSIFWPGVLGWILLGVWFTSVIIRITLIEKKEVFHA